MFQRENKYKLLETSCDLFTFLIEEKMKAIKKILKISKTFLGKPYVTDQLDCVTFVSQVLALTFSQSEEEARERLISIDYFKKPAVFENRCHFMSLDWNPHNAAQGYIKDMTANIVDSHHQSIVKKGSAWIDKEEFFKRKNIFVKMKPPLAEINYLPIEKLFTGDQLNDFIFNQLPELFILEIVRPNWDLTEKIGTHLNVSHLGFAFKKKSKPENKNDQWIFRHASSEEKKVVDVSLENYLKRYLHHETVKGINVQEILFPTS